MPARIWTHEKAQREGPCVKRGQINPGVLGPAKSANRTGNLLLVKHLSRDATAKVNRRRIVATINLTDDPSDRYMEAI